MSRNGAFGIILDDEDRILFCHRRDYDLWNLPGGGLEIGEAPWKGAIREVEEEVGLIVEVEKIVGIMSKSDKNIVVFYFLCNIIGGELTLTDEADQIEYFALEDIPENVSIRQREMVQKYLENKDKVCLSEYTGPTSLDLLRQKKI